jgi:hypothetical protein
MRWKRIVPNSQKMKTLQESMWQGIYRNWQEKVLTKGGETAVLRERGSRRIFVRATTTNDA